MRKYEPECGQTINRACLEMVALAVEGNETVEMKFNDQTVIAGPSSKAEELVSAYHDEMDRRRKEYLASPEYAERQKEDAERQAKKEADNKIASDGMPEKMTLRDGMGEDWEKVVKKNSDPYGRACIVYAETWARLMEKFIANGAKLEDVADRLSRVADTDGITGFMYGCAVGILSRVWIHGEQLRQWHNLKTQVKNEGKKANETGGVLNPAILTIG